MEVLILQKEAFEEMAAKFNRFSDRVNELLAKQGSKSLNPNRSLEKLAFTLLEIHYNYDNNQAVRYNSEHNKSYHLTF